MNFGTTEMLVVLAIVVLLFGGKRIPDLMRGMGQGIRNFKEGMQGDPPAAVPPSPSTPPVNPASTPEKK